MIQFLRMYRTSIGTKIVMAVTGLLLFLWIIAHMLDNLLVFAGQDAMNAYAFSLKELGPLLWIVRIGLLALFIVHILSAVLVWRSNRGARTEAYSEYDPRWATYAGRTMMVSGLIMLQAGWTLGRILFGITVLLFRLNQLQYLQTENILWLAITQVVTASIFMVKAVLHLYGAMKLILELPHFRYLQMASI